jgi:GTP-binding protein
MFVDEASITVFAGDGGDGCRSFRREKFVPRGGPDGGDGGKGGSVVLLADEGVSTLLAFRYRTLHRAQRGQHGQGSDKTGRSGEDLVIRVPVGTVVLDGDGTRLLADLAAPDQRFVAATGGRGGRGNARFATSTNRAPTRADPGEPGEQRSLRLELKLLADVGLVGFPNAGKSTLITRISAARPKIADYPFTTLAPHLGVVDRGGFRSFVVADLPGLIEGAHEGAGLGHRFLRHVERCRLLLHLVDPTDPVRDPVQGIEALNAELSGYHVDLSAKQQLIVLTKADAVQDRGPSERVQEYAAERGLDCRVVSSVSGAGVQELIHAVGERLDTMGPATIESEDDPHDEPIMSSQPEPAPVGVLGGTFDPVHRGHLAMAESALRVLGLERVVLLPTAIPPHKSVPHLTSAAHREAMRRLALEGRPGLELSTAELDTGQVCYTIDSLRALREGPPRCNPVFVLGTDSLAEIETWHEHEALLREFDLAVIARPGGGSPQEVPRLPDAFTDRLIDVSADPTDASTQDRRALGRGGRIFSLPMAPLPISSTQVRRIAAAGGELGDLVPLAVARYIRANGLYRQEDLH